EYPRVGQRGDHRVVDDQYVRRVALLRGEQRLAGQVGRVVPGALDGDAGVGAALVEQLDPVRGVVELRVRVPDRVAATAGGLVLAVRGGTGRCAHQRDGDGQADADGAPPRLR